jgi:hypothetical protein
MRRTGRTRGTEVDAHLRCRIKVVRGTNASISFTPNLNRDTTTRTACLRGMLVNVG